MVVLYLGIHMYIVITDSHKFELVVASIIVVMPRATTLFGIVYSRLQKVLQQAS